MNRRYPRRLLLCAMIFLVQLTSWSKTIYDKQYVNSYGQDDRLVVRLIALNKMWWVIVH